ncbi:MAG: cytochrome b/b6 domain-containing protein [Gammaproteobacteria bacterium]
MTETTTWSAASRLLHWAIVLTITFQQATGLFMSDPGTQFLFPPHRYIGLVTGLVLLLFWLYSYAAYDLALLFPWNRAAFRAIASEVLGLWRRRLPPPGRRAGLSSFVHGLGILAVSGCAVTGVVIHAMIPSGPPAPPQDPAAFTRYVLAHKFFADALWVYWAGHVGFALLHQLTGSNVFGSIFGRAGLTNDTSAGRDRRP